MLFFSDWWSGCLGIGGLKGLGSDEWTIEAIRVWEQRTPSFMARTTTVSQYDECGDSSDL